jgi:hypothetical protein
MLLVLACAGGGSLLSGFTSCCSDRVGIERDVYSVELLHTVICHKTRTVRNSNCKQLSWWVLTSVLWPVLLPRSPYRWTWQRCRYCAHVRGFPPYCCCYCCLVYQLALHLFGSVTQPRWVRQVSWTASPSAPVYNAEPAWSVMHLIPHAKLPGNRIKWFSNRIPLAQWIW